VFQAGPREESERRMLISHYAPAADPFAGMACVKRAGIRGMSRCSGGHVNQAWLARGEPLLSAQVPWKDMYTRATTDRGARVIGGLVPIPRGHADSDNLFLAPARRYAYAQKGASGADAPHWLYTLVGDPGLSLSWWRHMRLCSCASGSVRRQRRAAGPRPLPLRSTLVSSGRSGQWN